jgi:hypothetical protein
MSKLRWQDMVNLVLGVWIAASPWVLGFGDHAMTMWNALVVGGAILVIAAIDLDSPANWEEWATGALGVWLLLSPWILGYATNRPMMLSALICGALVAALAAWALYARGGFHRDHAPIH